jgi:hypothetical protein
VDFVISVAAYDLHRKTLLMSKQVLIQAYRDLYRHGLYACKHSVPARYHVRDILRGAFRDNVTTNFDPQRVQNTLRFLEQARLHRGIEHKITKNLLMIRWWRTRPAAKTGAKHHIGKQTPEARALRRDVYQHFDATLAMLNESQQLCLAM